MAAPYYNTGVRIGDGLALADDDRALGSGNGSATPDARHQGARAGAVMLEPPSLQMAGLPGWLAVELEMLASAITWLLVVW